MADFFGNLGKKLSEKAEMVAKKTGEVADVVAKKTEQTVEATKIKNQIRTMERNNERDLTDIGKMIYESYKNGEEVAEKYAELCAAIKEREEEIVKLDKEVADLLGKDVCPECKAHIDANASFCSKCGAKIEEKVEVVDVEVEDANDIAEVVEDVVEEVVEEAEEVAEEVFEEE